MAQTPSTKVILMTGYGSIDHAVQAMKAGAFHYLAKPFKLEELRNTISVALRHSAIQATVRPTPCPPTASPASSAARRPCRKSSRPSARLPPLNCNVLIQGESGTGKELVARAPHNTSNRAQHPFIPFNCGAFSEELVANELFGHEKGAFTGAVSTKLGLLEAAQGGTVFLDEVGEMPIPMQIKLLRVIQERTLLRVGGLAPININVRLIAATNHLRNHFCRQQIATNDMVSCHLPYHPVERWDIVAQSGQDTWHFSQLRIAAEA